MMPIVYLLFLLPVTATFGDQKQQLARCEIEAVKIYPSFLDAPSGQPLAYIQLCMKAAGYDWSTDNPGCGPALIMQGKPDIGDEGARCFTGATQ